MNTRGRGRKGVVRCVVWRLVYRHACYQEHIAVGAAPVTRWYVATDVCMLMLLHLLASVVSVEMIMIRGKH